MIIWVIGVLRRTVVDHKLVSVQMLLKHFFSGYVTLTTQSLLYTKNKVDEFHEHLNKQNTCIQFTKEIEENGKIPFLNCLVIRKNSTLRTTV